MAEETLRTETFPFGIASVGLGKVERQIPVDEPPPLLPPPPLLRDDATVRAVHVQEGDRVAGGALLVELED